MHERAIVLWGSKHQTLSDVTPEKTDVLCASILIPGVWMLFLVVILRPPFLKTHFQCRRHLNEQWNLHILTLPSHRSFVNHLVNFFKPQFLIQTSSLGRGLEVHRQLELPRQI